MPIEKSNRELIKIQPICEFWKQIFFSLKTFIGRQFEVGVRRGLRISKKQKKLSVIQKRCKQ